MGWELEQRALWIERNILPHEPGLRRYLLNRRLPLGLEVEDIIQESYARLANLSQVDNIRNAQFYLFQVARSIILAHVRRSKIVSIETAADLDPSNFLTDGVTPEIQASDREQLASLLRLIAALPEPGRQAFIMRTMEGLPHREIGLRLGMSDNAVQKSVAKSLRLLMKALGEGGTMPSQPSKSSPASPMVVPQAGD